MYQLKNKTQFPGMIFLAPDPQGVDSMYAVLKATFALGNRIVPADVQVPLQRGDSYFSGAGDSSLKHPSDLGLTKPATDVLLLGSAWTPGRRAMTQSEVGLLVGGLKKRARVFGDRVWEKALVGFRMSAPQQFERLPLVWERAFGGIDDSSERGPTTYAEERNPVGRGFRHANGQKRLEGMPLPNLEDPAQLVSSPSDRPRPHNFGPVNAHWLPRRTYAGTYDANWLSQRAPYLPVDFDSRFFNVAPENQIVAGYLVGGEPVEVHGASATGPLRFELPRYQVKAVYRFADRSEAVDANLDTVIIEPDESRLVLVWRVALRCDKSALRVREVELSLSLAA